MREGGEMKKNSLIILAIFLLLCLFGITHAAIWYVHPDSGLSSIQVAFTYCADNDTVLVGPGFYNEHIIWPSKQGIDLISEHGPDTTIIDGSDNATVITITTGVDSTTIINGFTLRNGTCNPNWGGGIHCGLSSSPTITGNIIIDNESSRGGGIYCCDNSSPTIHGNTILGNIANYGGGICCESSSPSITSNTFTANDAWTGKCGWGGYGGGIYCWDNSLPTIADNTITLSHAGKSGGGIYCSNSAPSILNNIIREDTAYWGGGGICCENSSPTIIGNTITSNTAEQIGGGGIRLIESSPNIVGNTITENIAIWGGGIACYMNSSPTIIDNVITGNTATNTGAGIDCWDNSSPSIDSCTISNNNGDGITCDSSSSPVINHNNIADNTGYGVCNTDQGVTIDAENNWWGDASGPGGFGPGIGDSVSNYVDYDPWLIDSIGIEEHESLQPVATVLQISPNPFSKLTTISFGVYSRQYTVGSIQIYDISGRLVRRFDNQTIRLSNQITWQGDDDSDRKLPGGVYFVRFRAGDLTDTQKLILCR